jgi:hypothetical protein
MNLRLFYAISTVLITCILGISMSGMSNSAFGIGSSVDPQNDFSSFITDIDKNVKTLTISGKDNSGNNFQIDLILNKDIMGMHQMMMQHMSMMGGMGHMGGMMNSSSMKNMMGSGSMGGMMGSGSMGGMMGSGFTVGTIGKLNNTTMQSCPCIQMMKFMQNQYMVEGGMIAIGSSTYVMDSGNVRVVDDKIFLNVHVGSFKAGKIIAYGKLNQDGGLKGILSLPEMRNISKITGTGSLADAFQ